MGALFVFFERLLGKKNLRASELDHDIFINSESYDNISVNNLIARTATKLDPG